MNCMTKTRAHICCGDVRGRTQTREPKRFCHSALFSGSIWCFITNGVCDKANRNINGMMPHTLNATQAAVEALRHTISLRNANARKKSPQRQVNCRHPVSSRSKACAKTYLMNKRLKL